MDRYEDLLIEELEKLSIPCREDQATLLCKHLDLVIRRNKEMNLTRIDSVEDGLYLHIIDSLICLRSLKSLTAEKHILDLGTGAGFPGIPLAVMLDADVTLLDSISKKAAAVEEFLIALGLSARCVSMCSRSEDLARMVPNSFEIVAARAVAQTNVLIEYAAPLLGPEGILCAWKAHITEEELSAALRAADICGMRIVSRETYELPRNYGHREIVYLQRVGDPSIPLPRRCGMAAKRPLGL